MEENLEDIYQRLLELDCGDEFDPVAATEVLRQFSDYYIAHTGWYKHPLHIDGFKNSGNIAKCAQIVTKLAAIDPAPTFSENVDVWHNQPQTFTLFHLAYILSVPEDICLQLISDDVTEQMQQYLFVVSSYAKAGWPDQTQLHDALVTRLCDHLRDRFADEATQAFLQKLLAAFTSMHQVAIQLAAAKLTITDKLGDLLLHWYQQDPARKVGERSLFDLAYLLNVPDEICEQFISTDADTQKIQLMNALGAIYGQAGRDPHWKNLINKHDVQQVLIDKVKHHPDAKAFFSKLLRWYVTWVNDNGQVPKTGCEQTITMLINAGADVNTTTDHTFDTDVIKGHEKFTEQARTTFQIGARFYDTFQDSCRIMLETADVAHQCCFDDLPGTPMTLMQYLSRQREQHPRLKKQMDLLSADYFFELARVLAMLTSKPHDKATLQRRADALVNELVENGFDHKRLADVLQQSPYAKLKEITTKMKQMMAVGVDKATLADIINQIDDHAAIIAAAGERIQNKLKIRTDLGKQTLTEIYQAVVDIGRDSGADIVAARDTMHAFAANYKAHIDRARDDGCPLGKFTLDMAGDGESLGRGKLIKRLQARDPNDRFGGASGKYSLFELATILRVSDDICIDLLSDTLDGLMDQLLFILSRDAGFSHHNGNVVHEELLKRLAQQLRDCQNKYQDNYKYEVTDRLLRLADRFKHKPIASGLRARGATFMQHLGPVFSDWFQQDASIPHREHNLFELAYLFDLPDDVCIELVSDNAESQKHALMISLGALFGKTGRNPSWHRHINKHGVQQALLEKISEHDDAEAFLSHVLRWYVTWVNDYGHTPIKDCTETIRLLVAAGADVNTTDETFKTNDIYINAFKDNPMSTFYISSLSRISEKFNESHRIMLQTADVTLKARHHHDDKQAPLETLMEFHYNRQKKPPNRGALALLRKDYILELLRVMPLIEAENDDNKKANLVQHADGLVSELVAYGLDGKLLSEMSANLPDTDSSGMMGVKAKLYQGIYQQEYDSAHRYLAAAGWSLLCFPLVLPLMIAAITFTIYLVKTFITTTVTIKDIPLEEFQRQYVAEEVPEGDAEVAGEDEEVQQLGGEGQPDRAGVAADHAPDRYAVAFNSKCDKPLHALVDKFGHFSADRDSDFVADVRVYSSCG